MAKLTDPADLIRVVADPLRLALLGRAAEGRVAIDEVAEAFDVPKRRVAEAVGKLRATGLIDDELRLADDQLQQIVKSLPTAAGAAAAITNGPWTSDEKQVLARFFSGSRLVEIPASRSKRRLVLERLAQEFEPGFRYQERDVNFTLQLFHSDYASLRRYMVEEGIMTRAEGVYWRTGGRYPTSTDQA
ncbi:MAG: DUF2087 domain-containing protein [Acidimicrobiia bacterium]|nr:DUF2087 domain-containing protein [Acidimicrobiia bacterium]